MSTPIGIQATSGATQIVYAPDGFKFAYMDGQTVEKYIAPLAAGMQAVYTAATPAPPAYWRHADWLGSSRLASTAQQTVYYDGMYAPFGENYGESGTTDRSFTGQTQDMTSGLYDFTFRQQSPSQGRWLVPDPAGMAAVDITNPQTWNRYAYVANNPLSNVDPLGLYLVACEDTGDSNCDDDEGPSFGGWGGICWGCYSWSRGPVFSPPPPPPPPQPPINFPNETLGLPNGFPTRPWGILPALFPSDLPCPAELSSLCGGIDPGMGIGVIWPQLTPLQTQCLLSALKTSGVSLGLDAAGFIPGEGLASALGQMGVGAASTIYSAMQGDVAGGFSGIAGFQLSALAMTGAKAIPWIGYGANALSTLHDLSSFYGAYKACMSKP